MKLEIITEEPTFRRLKTDFAIYVKSQGKIDPPRPQKVIHTNLDDHLRIYQNLTI